MPNPNASLVITSIAAPNAAMKSFAQKCMEEDMEFIVIGDAASPEDFSIEGCRFYSLAEQKKVPFRLAALLPENHYSRKNIGYLLSKEKQLLIESDDDNMPKESFWQQRSQNQEATHLADAGWVNMYRHFSDQDIWPRGFPLDHLSKNNPSMVNGRPDSHRESMVNSPIQQGLADGNPDVDAVYRLTKKLPINFDSNKPLAAGKNSWCPFNSQNTTWFAEAFLLLYLPSTCRFRMTDIWRSFIAQRIAWTCGWSILFHDATVTQERNSHDLMKDFEDEIPGYLHNAEICRQLEDMDLRSGKENLAENLIRCYRMMTKKQFISQVELPMVDAWIHDMSRTQ